MTRTVRPGVGSAPTSAPRPGSAQGRAADQVDLLWTGGWDSTFRLLQVLLVERRPVQPIYLLNPDRNGALHEVRAMEAVRRGVLPRLDDPSALRPTRIHVRDQFPPGPHLRSLHDAIAARQRIGTQYVWLAAAAQALHWEEVELCVEQHADGQGLTPYLRGPDGGPSRLPGAELFGAFTFPVLHLTKGDMRELARSAGFLDLLLLRWFCHDPLAGRPCGRCRPCQLAAWDGVTAAPETLVAARRAARSAARRARRTRR